MPEAWRQTLLLAAEAKHAASLLTRGSISVMLTQVNTTRQQMGMRVFGFDAPKPVQTFAQCGFDAPMMAAIKKAG